MREAPMTDQVAQATERVSAAWPHLSLWNDSFSRALDAWVP